MKLTIGSIQLGPNSVLTKTSSCGVLRLGAEIKSTVTVLLTSPSNTDAKPASTSAYESKSLPTYSIFTALNSVRRFFATAKYFAILAPRLVNNQF